MRKHRTLNSEARLLTSEEVLAGVCLTDWREMVEESMVQEEELICICMYTCIYMYVVASISIS